VDCGFDFEIDLVGVRANSVARAIVGQVLPVRLDQSGGYSLVVCTLPDVPDVVGSLANFKGLGALIACLRRGVQYDATVLVASGASCRVQVRNRPVAP
jgi:hypothetical protein